MAVTDNYLRVAVPPGHARNEWIAALVPGEPAGAEQPAPDRAALRTAAARHEHLQRVVDVRAERLGGMAFGHFLVDHVGAGLCRGPCGACGRP